MTRTLKQEFERKRKMKWLWVALLVLAAVVAWNYEALFAAVTQNAAEVFAPQETLRTALAKADGATLEKPSRGRKLQGVRGFRWNWVDAARRDEMLALEPADKGKEKIEAILRLANGRSFLFNPAYREAVVDTADGPVYVLDFLTRVPYALARDEKGGPELVLAPYTITKSSVAVPVEKLVDLATFRTVTAVGASWVCLVKSMQMEEEWQQRSERILNDPLAALHFFREVRS